MNIKATKISGFYIPVFSLKDEEGGVFMFKKRNGIVYKEKVQKIEGGETIEKLTEDEKLIIFELKNQQRITYLVDKFTFADVRKRLLGGLYGVLKIGEDSKDRIDLNQVEKILVDSKVIAQRT